MLFISYCLWSWSVCWIQFCLLPQKIWYESCPCLMKRVARICEKWEFELEEEEKKSGWTKQICVARGTPHMNVWWWMLKYCVKLNKYQFFVHWKLPFPVSMHNFFVCISWKDFIWLHIDVSIWCGFRFFFCSLHPFNLINHIFAYRILHTTSFQMLIYSFKFPILWAIIFNAIIFSLAFYYSIFINIFFFVFVCTPFKMFFKRKTYKQMLNEKFSFWKHWG